MLVERMPEVRTTGSSGQRTRTFVRQIDPIHDATQPNSAKINATCCPPISMTARAASALSHSMVSNCSSSSNATVRRRSSASSSTNKTFF